MLRRGRVSDQHDRQCDLADESEVKHPQVRQDHAQVVPGAAQQRVHRIAQSPLEPVAVQEAVGLHVPDHGLDGLPALEQLLQRARQPPGVADQQPRSAGRLNAAVTAVDQRDLRPHVGQDLDLLELAVDGDLGATGSATFSVTQHLVGFYVATNSADHVTIEAFSGATSLGSVNFPNPGAATADFIGIRDFAGLDRISVTTTSNVNGFFAMDDFRFESQPCGSIPVPGTMALVGLGLIGLGSAARRAKR